MWDPKTCFTLGLECFGHMQCLKEEDDSILYSPARKVPRQGGQGEQALASHLMVLIMIMIMIMMVLMIMMRIMIMMSNVVQ